MRDFNNNERYKLECELRTVGDPGFESYFILTIIIKKNEGYEYSKHQSTPTKRSTPLTKGRKY